MTSSDPIERSWELSHYELNRKPQEAYTDDTKIAVSARSLQSQLTCPICLDMLTQTMTTKECLHRFCAECIVTAIRSGNKECPTCRKKLVSKRSLRADPNFDRLVEKIFPNRDEYEAHQESILESLNKSHSQNFIATITDGYKAQMANARAFNAKQASARRAAARAATVLQQSTPNEDHNAIPPPQSTLHTSTSNDKSSNLPITQAPNVMGKGMASPSSSSSVDEREVDIVFQELDENINKISLNVLKEKSSVKSKRFIKTSCMATMDHLLKYLAIRLPLNRSSLSSPNQSCYDEHKRTVKELKIYIKHDDHQSESFVEICNHSLTISQVMSRYVSPKQTTALRAQMSNDEISSTPPPLKLWYSYKLQD